MASRAGVLLNFTRGYAKRTPKIWQQDGVKYGKVTYYPREKNHVDPPIVPTKLLMVERVKLFKGNPHWEKDILKWIGIAERKYQAAVVKNTPEMCAMLWKVKHLVKITPVKLPEKLPDPKDMNSYLHENGTLHIIPKVDPARYKATEEFIYDVKKFNCQTIKDQHRKSWLSGNLM